MMRISLENLVMSYCVKYERLGPLINYAFNGSNATTLNIYVDLYSITKSLYSKNHVTDIENYNDFTAFVINACGHYRYFFKRYLGVYTNIFLIHSGNCCTMNKTWVSGYNKHMDISTRSNVAMTTYINDNIDLLEILCPYLPDIHLVRSRSGYEVGVLVSHLIDRNVKNGNTAPNLLISKDAYNLQLCGIHRDLAYLRPSKIKGKDESIIIGPIDNKNNFVEYWTYLASVNNWKDDGVYDLDPIYTPEVLAFTSLSSRNITALANMKTAKSIIRSRCMGDDSTYNIMLAKVSEQIYLNRLKAIDIKFQKAIYEDSTECKVIQIVNRNDPSAVRLINDHYFASQPLDLERL